MGDQPVFVTAESHPLWYKKGGAWSDLLDISKEGMLKKTKNGKNCNKRLCKLACIAGFDTPVPVLAYYKINTLKGYLDLRRVATLTIPVEGDIQSVNKFTILSSGGGVTQTDGKTRKADRTFEVYTGNINYERDDWIATIQKMK